MVRESFLMKLRLTMGLEIKVSPGYKSEGFRNSKQGDCYGRKRGSRNPLSVTRTEVG